MTGWLPGMKPKTDRTDHDGAGDCWGTPPLWLDAIEAAAGEAIDLDPCCAPWSPVWHRAAHRLSLEAGDNGLAQRWPGSGLVFCNPPYSDVGPWLRRCRDAARAGRPVVALVPTRPETQAWASYVLGAGAWLVQQTGRIRFVGADGRTHGNGMVTTCLVVWDGALARRLRDALAERGVRSFVLRVEV